ncbi:MAG: nitronate monooxygenase, partial [Acidimicrobiia bacterium]
MRTRLTELFGIKYPIFAFSYMSPVVAAVTRAGGLGVLGAVRFTPEELENELKWLDDQVDGKPYGVDVVIPVSSAASGMGDDDDLAEKLREMIPKAHREFVDQLLEKYDVPPAAADSTPNRDLLGWVEGTARSQVDVALQHKISLLVSALGPPPTDVVENLHSHGVKVGALVGSADHARNQVTNGADIIIASGTEAGGHTGEVATMVLVPDVVDAVDVPVLAAGGIGSGRQMAAALALGAEGVWTGSVWLSTEEAGVAPTLQDELLKATSRDTIRSRAMTGKPARLLKTRWVEEWESKDSPGPLPMPLQYMLNAQA